MGYFRKIKMNKKYIAYKLIELYYTNARIFKSYCINLKELADKYNEILRILKTDLESNK